MSTAETTSERVKEMLALECRGWGDQKPALERIARKCSLSYWTLDYIRAGRAKEINSDVRDAITAAYISILTPRLTAIQTKLDGLQREIAAEKEINDDSQLEVLEAQAFALACEIEARRKKLLRRQSAIKGA